MKCFHYTHTGFFRFCLSYCFVFVFLGLHQKDMEVLRLGVELEL